MTTAGDLDADVDIAELVGTEDKDGLVELGPEDLRGEELEGHAVDLDHALALDATRHGCNCISDFAPVPVGTSNLVVYLWRSSSCRKPALLGRPF